MSLLTLSPCYCLEHGSGMVATALDHGLNPMLYDLGVASDGHQGNLQYFNLLPLLQSRTEDIILMTDCMDVAFLAGEDEIMEKYRSFNSPMVVSAEKDQLSNMGTTGDVLATYPGYFKNLNIGLWIGEREYAMHVLSESYRLYYDKPALPGYVYNSPQAWMNLMLAFGGGPEFALDRDCVLFQSMNLGANDADVVMEGKRAHNLVTNTYPVALHYNGDHTRVRYKQMVEYLLRRNA